MLGIRGALVSLGGGFAAAAVGAFLLHALRIARSRHDAPAPPRRLVGALAAVAFAALALAATIVVVPDGHAGIRVSDLGGAHAGILSPGIHFVLPLVERIALYDVRDRLLSTGDEKGQREPLMAQSREGLRVGLTVTVRYRLDVRRLDAIHANLPEAVDSELVEPTVATAFRQVLPQFLVREVFASRREEVRARAEAVLKPALESDGILVKEVLLRDVTLPAEFAKGLEALLLKEQENERLDFELQIKQKHVRQAELEAEAEAEKGRILAEAEANRIRVKAGADAERMRLEAAVLKDNPLLIQKIVAEKLSDKMQIMMVPMDGRYFFANDLLRGVFGGQEDAQAPAPHASATRSSSRR